MSVVFLIFWLAFQAVSETERPDLKKHVESGLSAKRAGDLETAIREFREVAELAPNLAAAHVNLGVVYCDKKDYAAAISPLKRALEINPDLPGVHQLLGLALLAQGYAAEAVVHLEQAHADALLGFGLLDAGRPREAVDKLEAALQKQPGDPDLLYYLAQAHARLSQDLFHTLRTDYPESARAQQLQGDAARASGDRASAEKYLRKALAARPDLRDVHYSLGELCLASGNYEGAEREFRAEANVNPRSAAVAYKLGLIFLNRGDVRLAVIELQRANSLRPGMPETLIELGKAIAASGDIGAAEKLFREALEQEQDSNLAETAHFQLAQIYRKLGRGVDAEAEMKEFETARRSHRPH